MDEQQKLTEIQKRLQDVANEIARLSATIQALREQLEARKELSADADSE